MLRVKILWAVTAVTPIVLVVVRVDALLGAKTFAQVAVLHVRTDVLLVALAVAPDAVTSNLTSHIDGTRHRIMPIVPSISY